LDEYQQRGCIILAKYSREQRIQAIQLLEDGRPLKTTARELGISSRVVMNWRYRYEAGGYEHLLSTRQHYTGEFKLAAIEYRRENGLSYIQAAADMRIPNEGTLYAWERLYEEKGAEGLQDTRKGRLPTMPKNEKKPQQPMTREQELEAENAYLKMENAYLKI
jgi:transposase